MRKRRSGLVLLLTSIVGVLLVVLLAALLGSLFLFPDPPILADAPPVAATAEDLTPPAPPGPPYFREVEDSGLDFTYRNGEEAGHLSILEVVGGGVGLIDYDGDGLLDVFVAGGGGYAGPDGKTIVGRPCKLYHNLGGFHFQDVTQEVGLEDFPWEKVYTHGVAVADYDRDGWPDLLVTGYGRVALFHNEPVDPQNPTKARRFVDVTEKAHLTGVTWATSAAWADFDGDGYPDLYVTQYVDWSWDNNPSCSRGGKPTVCVPQRFSGLPDKLFANQGDGTFKEVSVEAGLRQGGPTTGKGLAVLAVDVNDDGQPDLFACNDTTANSLYVNHCTPGRFRFEEVGVRSGTAGDENGAATGSMGVDAADYDGCGRPSLWVTNYEREPHALYHNDCKPGLVLFSHRTASSGIAVVGRKYVGWGTAFLDLEHRGWEDIVFVNGHIYMDPTAWGNTRRQKPVLLRNQGDGTFRNYSARGGPYFHKEHLARGVGFGDLDDDGRIDAVVSHINEPVTVLQNVAEVEGTHWLGVELVGKDHADVVGAKVGLEAGGRTQWRFAKGGGSYASSGDRRLVFGLAGADKIDRVTVRWPNLDEQTWEGDALPVDHYYRLMQGRPAPEKPRGRRPSGG